jgi:hypothetical protein
MRTLIRNIAAGIASAFFLLSALVPSFALTFPPTFAPRYFQTQQTHYVRFVFNYNSCVLASNTCSAKVGALPYNAFLTAIHTQIITTFNPTTSATVALGTASGGATIMAGMNVFTGASTAATLNTSFAGAGELVTGATATPSGSDGGFDLWATLTVGGGTPTQGEVVIILEFIAPNDGACGPQTLGVAAPAC